MNPLILIGGAVALLYLLRNRGAGAQDFPGYNPRVRVFVTTAGRGQAEVVFKIKPAGDTFRNNRLAGGIYLRDQKIADFRNSKNFTVRNKEEGVTEYIMFPVQYKDFLQAPEFWANLRAVGDFEAQNKEKIKFNNPIEVLTKLNPIPDFQVDFAKLFGSGIG